MIGALRVLLLLQVAWLGVMLYRRRMARRKRVPVMTDARYRKLWVVDRDMPTWPTESDA